MRGVTAMKISMAFTALLTSAIIGTAQEATPTKTASMNPCPGGIGSVEIDTVAVRSLDQLLQMANLVVVGTVVNVLPAFNRIPGDLAAVETDSLISITERLRGTVPSVASTIALFQIGGKAGPCAEVVPDDPLVKSGEQYVLFLKADSRTQVPNPAGVPRYLVVGVWSGKVAVVNGKIHFPPRAHPFLHAYDGADLASFIRTITERIGILSQFNLLH
jgi:hypothetical protein